MGKILIKEWIFVKPYPNYSSLYLIFSQISDPAVTVHFLNGNVNKLNCGQWSDEKTRIFREEQWPQKCLHILENTIIDPIFIQK